MKNEEKKFITIFNPDEKTEDQILFQQSKAIAETEIIIKLLSAVNDMVAILNQERQIVYANKKLLDWLQLDDIKQVCGLRFGEAAHCVHVKMYQAGCGTGEKCRTCAVLRTVLKSQQEKVDPQILRFENEKGEVLPIKISATPIIIDAQPFTIFSAIPLYSENTKYLPDLPSMLEKSRVKEFHEKREEIISLLHDAESVLMKIIKDCNRDKNEMSEFQTILTSVQRIKKQLESYSGDMMP